MPIFDFFRKFLGKSYTEEPPQNRFQDEQRKENSFRNPIWQTDDDDDDISDFSRHPEDRFQFRIFSDPFEMTRFFENQMDDMLRNFFNGFGGFGNESSIFLPFGSGLPMLEEKPKGPREEVMKPSYEESDSNFISDFTNVIPSTGKNDKKGDKVLKPAYEMPDGNNRKLDSDIDGKIQSNQLSKIWKNPAKEVETFKPHFSFQSFGKSVSTQMVRRPDGSIEQRRTIRDSEGNEETTITRQIGDKLHTIVTKKAKDGSEIKSEDIVNMDESELKGFDEKWTKIQTPKKDQADDFFWSKFFGPNPKL